MDRCNTRVAAEFGAQLSQMADALLKTPTLDLETEAAMLSYAGKGADDEEVALVIMEEFNGFIRRARAIWDQIWRHQLTMTNYVPNPIDTSSIKLTSRQQQLVERLAANVHDVWAQKRIADGWRHGASRNDDLKTHPGIVAYDALSESEKDYDWVMVEQVVRAALALGYRID